MTTDDAHRHEAEPEEGEEQAPATTRGPLLTALTTVLGDRFPDGPLGPQIVPTSLLSGPISLATENVIEHLRHCNDCTHLPRALLRYRKSRVDALRSAQQDIHRVLWDEPDHDLATWTKERTLEKHPDLVQEIRSSSLLEGERLPELLDELGPKGPAVLAETLWATNLEGPDAELLFRILVALGTAPDSTSTEPDQSLRDEDDRSRKAELRKAKRDARDAQQANEEAHATIRQKEQRLGEARSATSTVQAELDDVVQKLEQAESALSTASTELEQREREGEKAASILGDLRQNLAGLQKELRNMDQVRGNLALQLGTTSREVERLRLELASQPEGAVAASDFLSTEEERISQERLISSGAAKGRADDAWAAHRKLERAFLDAYPGFRQPRPETIRDKISLELVALGGSDEVGMSCYLLKLGEYRILIDCGIKPSGMEDMHPDLDRLDHLDALVLTHAHTDHVGWVPALVRRYPDLNIYCSAGTAALLPVMLEDCQRHYVRKIAVLQERAKHICNAERPEEEYDSGDVETVSELVNVCHVGEPEFLAFGGVSLHFFRAGHVLGASSVLIEEPSGRRVFVSGDFSTESQLTLHPASWPDDLGEIDLLVLESTYGNGTHGSFDKSREKLIDFIRYTLEERKGTVILASFGLGRAQELLRLIALAQESGQLSAATPVHIDGMIKRINPIYQDHADPPFELPESFNEISGTYERELVATHDAQHTPSIIVTTSGMLAGGPVVQYAQHLLPSDRNRIVLTGHQDEGAPSRAISPLTESFGGPRILRIPTEDGEEVDITVAQPAELVKLSAHADQQGLLEFAGRLQPRHIALVHGEPAAQKALRAKLLENHDAEIVCGPSKLTIP